MKKLINYLFYLSIILCFALIVNSFVDFLNTYFIIKKEKSIASIQSARMLEPVVKITHAKVIKQSFFEDIVGEDSGITEDEVEVSQLSSATGFSVEYNPQKNKTMIATNDHFCNSIDENSILFFENFEFLTIYSAYKESKNRVILTIPELDLCLIEIDGFVKPVEFAEYDYSAVSFQKLFIVGAPSGDFPIIIDTYLSASIPRNRIGIGDMKSQGHNFLLVSEQIFPGHSGSPVYTEDGRVIGIIFGALETYGGLAISHRDILETLELR